MLATDSYQVPTQLESFEIRVLDTGLGFTRSDDLTIVRVISKARPQAAKQRLYELVSQNLRDRTGISSDDVIVFVIENDDADWSFGQGRAQFLTGELAGSSAIDGKI